jgi:alpha-mannosidase
MSLIEVLTMDYSMFKEYMGLIPILDAQERIINNNVASYPHLKEKKRKEVFNELEKLATPHELLNESDVVKTDQMLLKLQRF